MTIRLAPVSSAVRSTWPRPKPPTPLEEAAAEAARQIARQRALDRAQYWRVAPVLQVQA